MSTWAYWIQSKKMILDLSISTNPSNCSYTFAANLHYSVNYNLFCLFICQIIISNLYNVYLNLHSHTCASLHSVFLPDTHHHREFFLETEQTTPITLTPQATSLELRLSLFSPTRKTQPPSVWHSCPTVEVPPSREPRVSLLHLHNITGGFCIKVNCFSAV